MQLRISLIQPNISLGLTALGLSVGLAGVSAATFTPVMAASPLTQLDNHPDLEGNQHTLSANSSATAQPVAQNSSNSNPLYNPWLALIPLAIVLAVVWWLVRRTNRPVWEQPSYGQYPFSMAGAKGGETKAYRNDNDVYVEKLRNQERRLREFYDNEPLKQPEE